MAASFKQISVVDAKQSTNFGHRGTSVVCLNDFVKERNLLRTRPTIPSHRDSLPQNDVSEFSAALFELDLGEEDETLIRAEEKTPVVKKLEALLEPLTSLEKQVYNDVKYLVLRHSNRHSRFKNLTEDVEYDQSLLAKDLQSLGYIVTIRQSVGGGSGAEGVTNLPHTFLRCTLPDSEHVFVVDTKFKEQFDIAHRTNNYQTIFSFIPHLLVLREDRITPAVRLICEELAESFRSTGNPLPPWRKADSLLSKWYPRRSLDRPLLKDTSSSSLKSTESLVPSGRSVPLRSTTVGITGSSKIMNRDVVPQRYEPFRIQAW